MIKVVAMFRLPEGTSESEFDKYFVKKHAKEAALIPGVRRYLIGKVVGSPAGEPAWAWVNELWFDSVKAALKAFGSKEAVDCTQDLLTRVKDFTPVFVKDREVKLPPPPAKKAAPGAKPAKAGAGKGKAVKGAKAKGGKKR